MLVNKFLIFWLGVICVVGFCVADQDSTAPTLPTDQVDEPATVLIVLLVRNKAHVLPHFLTYLEQQIYPKSRLSLWIRTDHNNDNSAELLELWLNHTRALYHTVDFESDNATHRHQNETSPFDWPAARFRHLIKLKEDALTYGHNTSADFIFFLDADVFLTSPNTLAHLVSLRLPIVAPMLLSEGLYSNFWCGMTTEYYYLRTDEYKDIYNVNKEGTFQVPMVHSAVLVHLKHAGARYLTFDRDRLITQQLNDAKWTTAEGVQCRPFDGPLDDIIIFAISANCSKISLYVSNDFPFGYILQPLETGDELQQDLQQLVNIRANIVHDLGEVVPVNDYFQSHVFYPSKHKLALDHIYMINLERRPARRMKMEQLFHELGLDVEYFAAVDGKKLDLDVIHKMGIKFLAGYEDPYHHRQMTMGEIGCFLSHYYIWEKIVEKGQKEVLVLEDDIRFEPYFKDRVERVLEQARSIVEYDLIYFGRKRLKEESEPWVAGSENLVHVGYSYWTLGYVITLEGARKLLAVDPLRNLIPVDEFLPVMFNRHPNKTWTSAYPVRNLIAFSAAPLLLFPTHYTGELGYISDTEDSELSSADAAAATAAAASSSKNAQLKSDREMDFPVKNKHDTGGTNWDGGLDLHVSKTHEEL